MRKELHISGTEGEPARAGRRFGADRARVLCASTQYDQRPATRLKTDAPAQRIPGPEIRPLVFSPVQPHTSAAISQAEDLDEAGKRAFDRGNTPGASIAGLQGPSGIQLYSTKTAEHLTAVNQYLRFGAGISARIREIAILSGGKRRGVRGVIVLSRITVLTLHQGGSRWRKNCIEFNAIFNSMQSSTSDQGLECPR